MNWYAIQTKPRQEAVAQSGLDREGVETFFPKLRCRRTIRRVRKWVIRPLFPSYIFARFDLEKSARLVKYAKGVSTIVSFGGRPAVVDQPVIRTIVDHCEEDVVTIAPPALKAGDMVEIQAGPFEGLEGIFEHEMSDSERVVILLHTLSMCARLKVSRSEVEPV